MPVVHMFQGEIGLPEALAAAEDADAKKKRERLIHHHVDLAQFDDLLLSGSA